VFVFVRLDITTQFRMKTSLLIRIGRIKYCSKYNTNCHIVQHLKYRGWW